LNDGILLFINFKTILFFSEFEAKAVEIVLKLITLGVVYVGRDEVAAYNESKEILNTLGIDIQLPQLIDNPQNRLPQLIDNPQNRLPQMFDNPRSIDGLKVERSVNEIETFCDEIQILSYICDICDKGFTMKIGLEKHRMKHFDSKGNRNQQGESSMNQTRRRSGLEEIIGTNPHCNELISTNHNLEGQQKAHLTSSSSHQIGIEIEEFSPIKSELRTSFSSLNDSNKTSNPIEASHECLPCGKTFPLSIALQQHLKKNCCNSTSNSVTLNEHFVQKGTDACLYNSEASEKSQGLKCPKCDVTKLSEKKLIRHLAYKHYRSGLKEIFVTKEWDCTQCLAIFQTEGDLLNHLAGKHNALNLFLNLNEDNADQPALICSLCPFKASAHLGLLSHKASQHYSKELKSFFGPKKWDCQLCKKNLSSEKYLLIHLAVAHREAKNIVMMSQQQNVEMTTQEGTTMMTTQKGTTVMTSQEGTAVMTSQSGNVVKYLCQLCDQETKSYPRLVMHLAATHFLSEMKPYFGEAKGECGVCHTIIGTKQNLTYHLVKKHNILASKIPTKKSFQLKKKTCNTPNQIPSQQHSEVRGRKRVSLAGVRYGCHLCDAPNDMYCRIVRHIAIAHYKDKLAEKYDPSDLNCIHCKMTFRHDSALVGHLASVHDELKDFIPSKESLAVKDDDDESNQTNFDAPLEQVIMKCNRKTSVIIKCLIL